MKFDAEKSQLLVFGKKDTEISVNVSPSVMKKSSEKNHSAL